MFCCIICIIVLIYLFRDKIRCPCACGATLAQVAARISQYSQREGASEHATAQPSTHQQINLNRSVTLHYTDWCGACKLMKPVYARVKAAVAGSGITFRELNEDTAKTPGINGYPTIILVDEFGHSHEYPFDADFERLRNWMIQSHFA